MTAKQEPRDDTDFNTLIRDMFHAEEWKDRANAVRNLGFLQDARAVNLMCRALKKEGEYMVVNRIIEALGRIRNPKATLVIIDKLKEEIEKEQSDKFRITTIIESLMSIKDKRALAYIGHFLNSEDEDIKQTAKEAFDVIEPNWREIVKKEKKKAESIEEIFKNK
ncbi:MAG: hypothetical protein EU541_06280 [Promethearchaeota archaeon]|nr:MAG: hypothetical protein EU541_06280 [Candidatus Lokiarchaeota archaeon]